MRIGIIAALAEEVTLLSRALEQPAEEKMAGTLYTRGTIGGHEVILMQCGMGKVSAGAGTQALITRYAPDAVINTGCAGGIAPGLGIGDLVIAAETAEWDLDTVAIGNPRGYVSSLDAVRVTADSTLGDRVQAAVPEGTRVHRGLVVSGDAFVSTQEQRALILESFPDALCAEMEGAAVGHVCAQNGVPFCVVRCMSDTADGESGVDFATFSAAAGEASAALLLRMLKN